LLPIVAMALAAAVVALCASCSRDVDRSPESVPDELAALYARIHEVRLDYERGIDLILCGEETAGRNLLTAASDRLRNAASLCSRTPGCRAELFNDALAHTYADRSAELASPELHELRAPVAEGSQPEESPVVGAIPEIGRTLALLHGTDLRELIPLNDQVKAALEDWLTWKRPQLIEAHEQYQFMREKMAPIYHEAGLPEALLFAILAKESGGKVHVWSRAGAAGLLQFMPRTALSYGLGSDDGFDLRLDPEASTRANAEYLSDQFALFNNDLENTLAAYNVGPTKLRRLARKNDGAGFWDDPVYNALPTETRNYVPQVLAAACLFLHPEEYGLSFPEREGAISTIVLGEPMSLGELTICLGSEGHPEGWFRTLRNLNARLSATERLPAGERIDLPSFLVAGYAQRCAGDSELLDRARTLHNAAYPPKLAVPQLAGKN